MNRTYDQAIRPYVDDGRTGSVMAVLEGNELGRVYLVDGVPVAARYRQLQGSAALDEIAKKNLVTLRFFDGEDIVKSREIIDDAVSSPAEQLEDLLGDVSVPPQHNLTDYERDTLAELLNEYVGPISLVLIADLPEDSDFAEAIHALAREIDDPRRAAEFIRQARELTL